MTVTTPTLKRLRADPQVLCGFGFGHDIIHEQEFGPMNFQESRISITKA
ncbi:hypothetical protein [Sulfitobacter dubius]|nr:hypothetical protein [Sulfitobacter dubius]MCZ4366608.1 hypothetical protein [Sulfitobacter dubius]